MREVCETRSAETTACPNGTGVRRGATVSRLANGEPGMLGYVKPAALVLVRCFYW